LITCLLTSNATCPNVNPATSNTLTMTVNPILPVSISIVASASTVCAGTSVNFIATPVNGGTIPAYQWKINGSNVSGATNPSYTYSPANGDLITCLLTSNATCPNVNPATSNTLTMTVNPILPVSISIVASASTVCAGTSVNFIATPVNGGTIPAYQWKINGSNVSGATNPSYTYSPANGDLITCLLTSNATCPNVNPATSNTLTMTVNPLLPVSVSIAASANPVCAGTSVTFTAVPVNGGSTPVYQWKVNASNVPGATNPSYTFIPDHGQIVSCVLTSSEICTTGNPASSNQVTMTVRPMLLVGSISADQTICSGTNPEPLLAIAPLNGTMPSYQWQSSLNNYTFSNIAGATIQNYQPGILLETTYFREMQNALETCGGPIPTNTLVVTVNPLLPVSVTIATSANPVCAGTSVNFIATPVNGGTTPSYQWKVNGSGVSGATNLYYAFIPADGDLVSCVLTSNATCTSGNPAVSNTIAMIVNPILPVSVTIATSANPVCAGTSVNFIATPVNGGTTPSYQWKVNGSGVSGATNLYYAFIPADGDLVSCVLTSNATCTSGNPAVSNTIAMIVNPILPVSITIASSANPVCAGTTVNFIATPVNGGATPMYQWKVNGSDVPGATNLYYAFIPADGDLVSCIMTSNATCTSGNPAVSNAIAMIVNPILPVNVTIQSSENPVFAGTLVTFTAMPVNGGTSPTYLWKVNGVVVSGPSSAVYSYVPVDGDIVTCSLYSSIPCVSNNPAISNSVTMSVSSVANVVVLQNLNITGIQCFDAIQTITVAGGGTSFTVQNGGHVTMIAGQKINYLPGTSVKPGGYMRGYITLTGEYCGSKAPTIATVTGVEETNFLSQSGEFFRVYPNPTEGIFVLELNGIPANETILVEIYNMTGEKVSSAVLSGLKKHSLSISGKPAGIYLVQVVSAKKSGITRVIKR
jgi:hypothetical protein